MSLIVARQAEGQITIVSDTKLTLPRSEASVLCRHCAENSIRNSWLLQNRTLSVEPVPVKNMNTGP